MASGEQRIKMGAGVVKVPVNASTVINVGDMVWLDSDDAKPASETTWSTNLAGTQAAFKAKCLGVSLHASANGDTNDILVAYGEHVAEFDCDSATFEIGGLVGPAKGSGNTIVNQKVATAVAGSAIGIVHQRVNPASTRVLVKVISPIMTQISIT